MWVEGLGWDWTGWGEVRRRRVWQGKRVGKGKEDVGALTKGEYE